VAEAAAPAAIAPSRRWLFGPVPDLLLGCGIGYAFLFAAMSFAGPELRWAVPFGLAPLVALVSGTPHYGATLLRVYERRADRRAYALFTVWATLAVAAAFVWGLHDVFVGSVILTIYLTWSPWHYTGQNYGISLMFLGRRGVRPDPATKRWIYVSFVLSFVLTILAIHVAAPSADYAPLQYQGGQYVLLPLGIPTGVQRWLFVAVGAAYLVATAGAAFRLLRTASARDLAPTFLVMATQALWFSVPVVARQVQIFQGVEPLSTQYAAYAFLWIATGHSLQYLWVTTYYARAGAAWSGYPRYFGACLLAGAAIWALPALLFAPGLLASVPYDVGLGVLVAAAVNLHHFILDGAIWKLRDGKVARVLIRASGEEADATATARGPWLRRAIFAAGAVSVAVLLGTTLEEEFGFRRAIARGDAARAELALARLERVGRDSPSLRVALAILAAQKGDEAEARAQLERSLALRPTPEAWRTIGWLHERAGESARAIAPYREALKLAPDFAPAANNLAWLLATHENPLIRNAAEANRLAEGAARKTAFRDPAVLDTLAAARAASLDFVSAGKLAEAAVARAGAIGADADLVAAMSARLEGYRRGEAYVSSDAALAADAREHPIRVDFRDSEGIRFDSVDVAN
jgi:tetratricopeptide (TPR) repeat protein